MTVEDEFRDVVVHLDGDLGARLLAVARRLGKSPDAVIQLAISHELAGLEADKDSQQALPTPAARGAGRVTRSAPAKPPAKTPANPPAEPQAPAKSQ